MELAVAVGWEVVRSGMDGVAARAEAREVEGVAFAAEEATGALRQLAAELESAAVAKEAGAPTLAIPDPYMKVARATRGNQRGEMCRAVVSEVAKVFECF